jgi:hypothetical protein
LGGEGERKWGMKEGDELSSLSSFLPESNDRIRTKGEKTLFEEGDETEGEKEEIIFTCLSLKFTKEGFDSCLAFSSSF